MIRILPFAAVLAFAATAHSANLHWGVEKWICTDTGGGQGTEWTAVLGTGATVNLLGIYGVASLAHATSTPDDLEREALWSISGNHSADGTETSADPVSHHGVDGSYYAAIMKQTASEVFTLPIAVTFPGNGIPIPGGAIRLDMVTGAYDPANAFQPVNFGQTPCLDAEVHITFVFQ
jgi:hypothetical protein